jgi:hypothetical protein
LRSNTSPQGDQALAEEAGAADHDLVARLQQVEEAALHPGHAGRADREGHAVLCAEDAAQQVLRLAHHVEELRVEVAQERRRHHGQHARVHVAGARAHQEALGDVQLGDWRGHASPGANPDR